MGTLMAWRAPAGDRRRGELGHEEQAVSKPTSLPAILHRFGVFMLLTGGLVAGEGRGAAVEPRGPNVLLLVADDLAVRLGCYGDPLACTPHLDRLAASGIVFTHAYCQGGVCTPSRTSFMLGRDNAHANPDHFRKHPDTMTLGRWFRDHGYQTFSVGKIDHTEEYVDPRAWEIRVPTTALKPAAGLRRRRLSEDQPQPDGTRLDRQFSFVGVADADAQLHDAAVADRAIRFLAEQRDPGRPFFAAVGFHAPHVPWDAAAVDSGRHEAARFPLEHVPDDASPLPQKSLLQEPGLALSEVRQREALQGYYAAVTLLDRQIGRLLERLEAANLAADTVVVFTADHGYHLGWRGQWCKHALSEQVMRVPLIVRLPGGRRGAQAAGIVELVDLFPSLCVAAGLPAPEGLDGRSFVPLLVDPAAAGKAAAFCRWGNGRTVRTPRYRYTERTDGSAELYDHDVDPGEYHDVADVPALAAVVREHAALLAAAFDRRPE